MEIAEIKQQLSIAQVLDHYGLKSDRNRMLCCPFHDDKTPSMQVYAETNTVFCFSSSCKLHGKAIDQIDFILHRENLTKHEAILKAQSLLGRTEVHQTPFEKPAFGEATAGKLFKVFQTNLKKSEYARAYLQNRNISAEAAQA